MDPRNFARWAKRHGLEPERRVRVGRSFVTVWVEEDLWRAAGVA